MSPAHEATTAPHAAPLAQPQLARDVTAVATAAVPDAATSTRAKPGTRLARTNHATTTTAATTSNTTTTDLPAPTISVPDHCSTTPRAGPRPNTTGRLLASHQGNHSAAAAITHSPTPATIARCPEPDDGAARSSPRRSPSSTVGPS
ncbi:hypothetical protein [Frankia sp. EAN1pec]|uniref:hypothetical protein n=1 Tax=Parafrankia sp. (strain EAN1pec) TaxID=298653 RepID=UPI0012FA4B81